MPGHDISAYTPMTDEEAPDAVYFAVKLNLHRLPQLKGKGKVIGAEAHDQAARFRRCGDEAAFLEQRDPAEGPPLPTASGSGGAGGANK